MLGLLYTGDPSNSGASCVETAISIPADSKNLTEDSPGQPGLTLKLALLLSGPWTRRPFPPKLFCGSVNIDAWM